MTYSSTSLRLIEIATQPNSVGRKNAPVATSHNLWSGYLYQREYQATRGVPLAAVRGASSCIMSYGDPSARDSPSIRYPMYRLETGKAALLGIGEQGHAMPAHAADINAFLVIASFIL